MEFYDSLRQRLDPFRFYPSLISNLSTLNFLILIVEHQYDLQYLFHMEIFPYFDKLAPEIRLSCTRLCGRTSRSKVKNGELLVPNDNEAFRGVTWDRFARDNYLEISLNSIMRTGLYDDRMGKLILIIFGVRNNLNKFFLFIFAC